MKRIIFIALFSIIGSTVSAQNANSEIELIKKTINQLFEGMRNNDTVMVRNTFSDKALLQTVVVAKDGQTKVLEDRLQAFLVAVAKPKAQVWDERIIFDKILIDGRLASVWTPYKFYVGDKFSHCGVDSFQMIKTGEEWKILYLIDTRRIENCD